MNSLFTRLCCLLNLSSSAQYVVHQHEIIVCAGRDRNCYSYDILTNKYKFICKYPSCFDVIEHRVVKFTDNSNNNKDTNEITLLAFDAHSNHVLMMKYVSAWNKENTAKILSKSYNEWDFFKDNHNNPIFIGGNTTHYNGLRAVIGGSNNHLLFITYYPKNIDVFNLNTLQFIKQENLPIDDETYFNCFVLNAKNANDDKNQKGKNEMWLFYGKKGLSIEYDEDNNTFKFYNIRVCTSLKSLSAYACICVNDCILFFGGRNNIFNISSGIYKYSITRNQWMISKQELITNLCNCVAVLSEEREVDWVAIHIKTKVEEWTKADEEKWTIESEE
ncbi:hypothetical protein RFI_40282, partial [Reticulomyxa filosa]